MIIAVNTRTISGNEEVNQLLINHVLNLASLYPGHQFVLISQKPLSPLPNLTNVKVYLLPQQSNNSLLWKLWYHYKLPAAIRKIKADILLSTDGILSKRIKVPQYLLVSDIGFLSFPDQYDANYTRFARSNSGDFFQKAEKLIALNDYVRNEIIKQYNIEESKLTAWHPGIAADFEPADVKKTESFKEQHTDGRDYILFYGAIAEKCRLVNILKAFSLFKKRLKTNMQLIIASHEIPPENEFVKSLSLYKYRDDVKLMDVTDQHTLATMIGAAYTCINLSPSAADGIFLLQSLKCGVPVIAGNFNAVISLINTAALYADPLSVHAIAEKLMLLYKDEKKRAELILDGLKQVTQYDAKNATVALATLLLQ